MFKTDIVSILDSKDSQDDQANSLMRYALLAQGSILNNVDVPNLNDKAVRILATEFGHLLYAENSDGEAVEFEFHGITEAPGLAVLVFDYTTISITGVESVYRYIIEDSSAYEIFADFLVAVFNVELSLKKDMEIQLPKEARIIAKELVENSHE